MKAIESGTMAAAEAPPASLAAPSALSEPAKAAAPTVKADTRVASATSRYFPKRSPSAP
jgi:hypothetical protein